jgi:hypothetical protein
MDDLRHEPLTGAEVMTRVRVLRRRFGLDRPPTTPRQERRDDAWADGLVDAILAALPPPPKRRSVDYGSFLINLTIRDICARHGVDPDDMPGPKNSKTLHRARRAVAQALTTELGMTKSATARILNRDRSTVWYMLRGAA